MRSHPLLDLAAQLRKTLPVQWPVAHPREQDAPAVSAGGVVDGTVKVYDARRPDENGTYGTHDTPHQDGLGCCQTIDVVALYADAAPLTGGYTYFQNLLLLSWLLAKKDREAFDALFLPQALTVRRLGATALQVTGPVFSLDGAGNPQVFFRPLEPDDTRYQVHFRTDIAAVERGINFLSQHCAATFSSGATFLAFSAPGQGCFFQNWILLHGRTRYVNGPEVSQQRVVSRKWFATTAEQMLYRQAPGLVLQDAYAQMYPELFGTAMTQGMWRYDHGTAQNVSLL